MNPLELLLGEGLITEAEHDAARAYLRAEGGSVLNALASQPGLRLEPIWQRLAQLQRRDFLPSAASASPLDAQLLTREQATDFLVLGRRVRFQTVLLMTPDPLASAGDLTPLKDALGPLVPGGRAALQLDVCTPHLWKQLFEYSYPTSRYVAALSERESLALASLTPARALPGDLGEMLSAGAITHEQHAEALARQLNLPYLDAQRTPPDRRALDVIPPHVARSAGVYPHSLTRDGRVVLLTPHEPGGGTLTRLRRLTTPTLSAVYALVSERAHTRLMHTLTLERTA